MCLQYKIFLFYTFKYFYLFSCFSFLSHFCPYFRKFLYSETVDTDIISYNSCKKFFILLFKVLTHIEARLKQYMNG